MMQVLNEFMASMLLLSLCAGIAFGIIFFGGLWWTVKLMHSLKQPALWFFVSFIVRVSLVLYGVYWVANGQWQLMLMFMLGFLVARFVIHFGVRALVAGSNEASHES
jgi:F1F0 ATPase subunit 2